MKKYHVALSLKQDSVGWSILDDKFRLKKVHIGNSNTNLKAIGVDKFTPGKTAAETRVIRSNRRRLARRKKRIAWLNDIFDPYLENIDPMFLNRLKYSNLAGDDKKFTGGIIFPNREDEQRYYQKYPTIFHLRYALMTEKEKFDLRLVYLAIHNIVKYRGNFNDKTPMASFNTESLDYAQELEKVQKAFDDTELSGLVSIAKLQNKELKGLLLTNELGKREQKKQLTDLLLGDTNKVNKQVMGEIIKAILGSKFDLDNLLQNSEESGIKLSFADEDIDDTISGLEASLTNEQQTIILGLHNIYLGISLEKLVPNGETFSQAQIKTYNRFHDQYKVLVAFRKQVTSVDDNKAINEAIDRYASPTYQKKGKVDREGFYNLLKPYLKKYKNAERDKIKKWIDEDQFMVKPRNKRNQLIPHQLHQYELDQIIENQGKYYPFLKELNPRENRQETAKYKLDELVAFRLPYYVGPLVDNSQVPEAAVSRYSWVDIKKNRPEEITPWNFDKYINLESTAKAFIRSLTAKDSVLISEDVLPSSSILYQRFNVLNELNKVRIDGKLLRSGDKQKVFNDLFRTHKKVSVKTLQKYLKSEFGYKHEPEISGLSQKDSFNSSYSTYIDLKRVIGSRVDNPDYQNDLEQIVEWSTVFPQGPMFRHNLDSIKWLNTTERNKLAALHYSGWGRYSKELLAGLVNQNGERVIDVMWNTNLNFAQVISQPDFKKELSNRNEAYLKSDESFEDVLNNTYTSPQNRKAIRQAMYVLEDITKKMGHAPATVSLQFLRYTDSNSQSQPRQKQLSRLYKEITKKTAGGYFEDKQQLVKELKDVKRIDDRLYLYFSQLGRDLYTGQKINLKDVTNHSSNLQVVHILPPTFVKDESLNNKALIYRQPRQINLATIRNSMRNFWQLLQRFNLLTNKKMANLLQDTSAKTLGRGAREGYTRRALTANSQIIKLAATFINERYANKGTKVITVKNELVEQLKTRIKIDPRLSLGDYQNGVDAYLTGVAGLYLIKVFPKLESFFVYGSYPYNIKDLSSLKSFNFLYHILRKEDDFIIPGTGGLSVSSLIELMVKVKHLPKQIVTNQPVENHGALYKQTIFPHQDYTKKFIPIKKNKNPQLYGGYRTVVGAFLSLVRVDLPNNQHYYRLVTIPRSISDRLNGLIRQDKSKAAKLIIDLARAEDKPKEKQAKISVELMKVYYHQSAQINGANVTIGSAKYLWSADELLLSDESQETLALQHSNKLDEVSDLDERLIKVYDEIVNKLSKYLLLFSQHNYVKKFQDSRSAFVALPAWDSSATGKSANKISVLNGMIYALRAGSTSLAFTSTLKMKGRVGSIYVESKLNSGDSIYVTSPAGLFVHTYKLQ